MHALLSFFTFLNVFTGRLVSVLTLYEHPDKGCTVKHVVLIIKQFFTPPVLLEFGARRSDQLVGEQTGQTDGNQHVAACATAVESF